MAKSSISLLTEGVREASKFLRRDYFELENLQNSKKNTDVFVTKARTRALENLQKSLGKYYKTIIFSEEEASKGMDAGNNDSILLIEALEGADNFARAIPFFAVAATILTKKDNQYVAEKVVMNFPALGNIYYSEKGKGAWLEKELGNFSGTFRLRMAAKSKLEDAIVSCDYQRLNLAEKITSNIRMVGSYAYHTSLLISGKSDCELSAYKPLLHHGFELFILESGGGVYIKNGVVVASNYILQDKLKQVI